MGRARPLFRNFTAGEIAPQLDGLLDSPLHGCRTLENFIVRKQSGIQRRPGTKYAGAAHADAETTRIYPFTNTAGTSFVLEFADEQLTIWKQSTHAVVGTISGAPWDQTDVFELKMLPIGDNLYITHKSYQTTKLVWLSDTSWGLETAPFVNESRLVSSYSGQISGYPSLAISQDGITWTRNKIVGTLEADARNPYRFFENCGGTFLGLYDYYGGGPSTIRFHRSSDLQSWIQPAGTITRGSNTVTAMAASDDVVVVTLSSLSGQPIYTSADLGDTWTVRSIPAGMCGYTFLGCVWASRQQLFVAASNNKGIITSPDGTTWTQRAAPAGIPADAFHGIYYANGRIFLNARTYMVMSTDGIAYEKYLLPIAMPSYDTGVQSVYLLYDTVLKRYVAIWAELEGSNTYGMIVSVSPDGTSWSAVIPQNITNVDQVRGLQDLRGSLLAITVREKSDADASTFAEAWVSSDRGTSWVGLGNLTAAIGQTVGNFRAFFQMATKFGNKTGKYPSAIGYSEQRLMIAGSIDNPDTVWGSTINALEDFTTGYLATSAIDVRLASARGTKIYWMETVNKGICIGAENGVGFLQGAQDVGLTPFSAQFSWAYPHGSADIQGIRVGDSVFYATRGGEIIRAFPSDAEVTLASSHITKGGVTQFEYMDDPQCIFFATRADGQLLTMTVEKAVSAWSRWKTRAGDEIESIAIVPAGTEDEIWMCVKRVIGGATKRFIEYSVPFAFEDKDHAHFVDCGVEQENADQAVITNITKADPAVVTASGHPFANGDTVLIRGVVGMTEVNNIIFTVSADATDTFALSGINSTNYTAYASGGGAYEVAAGVSGLTHLNGESVVCLIDGNVVETHTVAANAVTLTRKGHHVHVGLPYSSKAQLCRLGTGFGHGIPKQISKLFAWVHDSIGGKFGASETATESVAYTKDSELTEDVLELAFPGSWDDDSYIWAIQSDPLPMTIMALGPELTVGER